MFLKTSVNAHKSYTAFHRNLEQRDLVRRVSLAVFFRAENWDRVWSTLHEVMDFGWQHGAVQAGNCFIKGRVLLECTKTTYEKGASRDMHRSYCRSLTHAIFLGGSLCSSITTSCVDDTNLNPGILNRLPRTPLGLTFDRFKPHWASIWHVATTLQQTPLNYRQL